MNTATNPLAKVRARDIMKSNVFRLEPTTTIEEAVTAFAEMHISGAPVVDRSGRLVGVLSAFDIARPENMRDGLLQPRRGDFSMGEASPDDDGSYDEDVVFSMEDYSPDVLRSGTVADLMTSEVISVPSDATLKQMCTLLVKEHIHRVMVVDDHKLVGIVTSLDIVRAVGAAL